MALSAGAAEICAGTVVGATGDVVVGVGDASVGVGDVAVGAGDFPRNGQISMFGVFSHSAFNMNSGIDCACSAFDKPKNTIPKTLNFFMFTIHRNAVNKV